MNTMTSMMRMRRAQVIAFRHREDHAMLDKPHKASKYLPQWFKNLPRTIPGEHKNTPGTVKRCIPALEACTQGFIIPSWTDWHIIVADTEIMAKNEEGEEIVVDTEPMINVTAAGNLGLGDAISKHGWEQVGDDCPLQHYPVGKVLLKFTNPWVIETAPGWSCAFKSPANSYNNIRLVEGVVDTDTYRRQINFPFFWDGCKKGEYEINKGDPLVHVIPFKREKLELQFDTWDHEYMSQMDVAHDTHFYDKYRKLWWHKRKQ